MVAKVTRLTQTTAILLHLVAEGYTTTVFVPSGESGNFWICLCIWFGYVVEIWANYLAYEQPL